MSRGVLLALSRSRTAVRCASSVCDAIPVAVIVTEGRLHFDDGAKSGEVGAGEMLLINPGERHTYQADIETSAYLVFAGLPGVRSRTWNLRRKE